MTPEDFARWLTATPTDPLSPGARAERAQHRFDQIVDRCRRRHGLAMAIGEARQLLGQLRPWGNWNSYEIEHYHKAVAALERADQLLQDSP